MATELPSLTNKKSERAHLYIHSFIHFTSSNDHIASKRKNAYVFSSSRIFSQFAVKPNLSNICFIFSCFFCMFIHSHLSKACIREIYVKESSPSAHIITYNRYTLIEPLSFLFSIAEFGSLRRKRSRGRKRRRRTTYKTAQTRNFFFFDLSKSILNLATQHTHTHISYIPQF